MLTYSLEIRFLLFRKDEGTQSVNCHNSSRQKSCDLSKTSVAVLFELHLIEQDRDIVLPMKNAIRN